MATENKRPKREPMKTINGVEIFVNPPEGFILWCTTCLKEIGRPYKNATEAGIEEDIKKHIDTH